jgi:hypothetical protein
MTVPDHEHREALADEALPKILRGHKTVCNSPFTMHSMAWLAYGFGTVSHSNCAMCLMLLCDHQ